MAVYLIAWASCLGRRAEGVDVGRVLARGGDGGGGAAGWEARGWQGAAGVWVPAAAVSLLGVGLLVTVGCMLVAAGGTLEAGAGLLAKVAALMVAAVAV